MPEVFTPWRYLTFTFLEVYGLSPVPLSQCQSKAFRAGKEIAQEPDTES
jgi:hypothetical protein